MMRFFIASILLVLCLACRPISLDRPSSPVTKLAVEDPSIRILRDKAMQGDVEAQTALGMFYHQGKGVPHSYTEAVKWYQKAAKQGFPKAEVELGSCYYLAQGVPRDYEMATKYYHEASKQGYAEAQLLLGHCYWSFPKLRTI